nr:unnamed protein product [Callosobruchus analis]
MASKYVIKLHDIMMFFKDEEKLISKGENAVESGHVTSLISDADLHLIRGKVHASMKDREYNVEVEFNSEWVIISATCNCPRGQLRCHHMAALIVFARDNISVTDKECMWSKPKQLRDPDVKKLSDLYPPKDHRSPARDLTDEEIEQFKHKLSVFFSSTYNMEHLKAIQWGNMHEKEGIKSLEDSLNVKVVPTGIRLHECGYLGASPDGLIGENEIVEVKCPYKYRDVSLLDDIKSSRNYIIFSDEDGNITETMIFSAISRPISHNKKKNAHLVIWTPKEVAIVNIEAECFNEHLNVLKMFYFEHYIPFLLGKNICSWSCV